MKDLSTEKVSKGFYNVKVWLFLILNQKGLVMYILNPLLDAKLYPRFYISLLELANLFILLKKIFQFKIEDDKKLKA